VNNPRILASPTHCCISACARHDVVLVAGLATILHTSPCLVIPASHRGGQSVPNRKISLPRLLWGSCFVLKYAEARQCLPIHRISLLSFAKLNRHRLTSSASFSAYRMSPSAVMSQSDQTAPTNGHVNEQTGSTPVYLTTEPKEDFDWKVSLKGKVVAITGANRGWLSFDPLARHVLI
jgi:hypothetical protein